MLQTILDIILFVPRKIYYHFEDYRSLKAENKYLEEQIADYQRLLKRIKHTSTEYMQQNQSVSYVGFQKVKELAEMFPNDN